MKKALSLILLLALLASVLPCAGMAAEEEREIHTCGDYDYVLLDNGTAEITVYAGDAEELTIPETLDGYPVTAIGAGAFAGCESLKSVEIPGSVTAVGANPFEGCEALTAVSVSPDHPALAVIGGALVSREDMRLISYPGGRDDAFYGIPQEVAVIGDRAFAQARNLAAVFLTGSETAIGEGAFAGCENLANINLPASIAEIGENAFDGCEGLTLTVRHGSAAERYCLDNGLNCVYPDVLPTQDPPTEFSAGGQSFEPPSFEIPSFEIGDPVYSSGDFEYVLLEDGTAEISRYLISIYSGGRGGTLTIPDTLDGHTVTSIGAGAFTDGGFERVVIPGTVTVIGDRAFFHCEELESASIPGSVTAIGDRAFAYCFALADAAIPEGVTAIGSEAFSHCHGLTSVRLPDSVAEIGDNPFRYCMALTSVEVSPGHPALEAADGVLFGRADRRLITCLCTKRDTAYEIPEGTEIIGAYAFTDDASLRSVTIPESVTELGEGAFAGCEALESVVIPGGVRAVGDWAFALCKSLRSVVISDGVGAIGAEAFALCESLESLELPDSVASVGDGAFADCVSLAEVMIPAGVAELGENPFTGCVSLTSVSVAPGHPALESIDGVLFGKADGCLVCYPLGRDAASYEIPQGTARIGGHAFAGCESLERVVIPDSVTFIGDWAFYHCGSLADAGIPAGVAYIGENTFSFCNRLTLTVARGSFAERYCAWKGLACVYADD